MRLYLFEEILILVAVAVMAAGLFIGSIAVRVVGGGGVKEMSKSQ